MRFVRSFHAETPQTRDAEGRRSLLRALLCACGAGHRPLRLCVKWSFAAIPVALLLVAPALAQETTPAPPVQNPEEQGKVTLAEEPPPPPVKLLDYVASGAIELDWRFTSLDGSENAYRSQVDLPRGPSLGFSRVELRSADNTGPFFFDDLVVEGLGWGGEPTSTAHVRVAKQRFYTLDFNTRHLDSANFVPDFANPFFASGAIVSPHGWDRRRRIQSFDLKLLPQRQVEGFFAYERSSQSGLGFGTDISSDQLVFDRDLDNHSHQVRGGVTLHWSRLLLSLEQGVRFFEDSEVDRADASVVIDPETLAGFRRSRRTDTTAPSSRAFLSATPVDGLRITARTLYTSFDVKGSLIDAIDAIGSDPVETASTGRAGGHAFVFDTTQSYRISDRVTLRNEVQYRRNLTVGARDALFTVNGDLSGGTREVADSTYRYAWLFDQPELEVDVTKDLVVRTGYRFARRHSVFDFDKRILDAVTGDAIATLIVPQNDRERIDAFLASGSYRLRHDARLFVEYENGREPNIPFSNKLGETFFDRSGDYQELRVRGMLRPTEWLQLDGSVRTTERSFHSSPIVITDLEPPLEQSRMRAASLTVRVTPTPRLSAGASFDRLHTTADINFLRAVEDEGGFARQFVSSRYLDDEGLVTADLWARPVDRLTLTAVYSLVSASGSLPVHYHQAQVRGVVRFTPRLSGLLEWRRYDYDDHRLELTDYRADHATVGVRWEW